MDSQASVFEYMYRDGGNFKTHSCLLVTGRDPEREAKIRSCLEWSDQFVAEQIGVPSLCREHWEAVGEEPSALDHAYHEFVALRAASEEDKTLPIWDSLETLIARMEAAARQWDVRLSPNCDL